MTQSQRRTTVRWPELDRLAAKRGWTTDQELARRLGISASHLSNMRKGEDGPGEKFKFGLTTIWGDAIVDVLFDETEEDHEDVA